MSLATSKPEEDCERTEDAEETHEPYCDKELAEDKMNTKSEELNSAGLEGIEKSSETVVSFPGLPRLQFLIACSFCILQAIKNWNRGRPGNEASTTVLCYISITTVQCFRGVTHTK